MNRRQFLASSGLLLGGLLAGFQTTRPNICLILADDLPAGALGCYGQRNIQTPHLDALAAGGQRFSQAYSPSPMCAPSRWGLLTGQHTGHAAEARNWAPLRPQDVTIAQRLQGAYDTACFGKWGLGHPLTYNAPLDFGFDTFLGYMTHEQAWDYYAPVLWENDQRMEIPENAGDAQGLYIPDLLTQRAIDYLSQPPRRPFFLYLPFTLPHPNGNLPAPEGWQIPGLGPYAGQPWTETEKRYAAMITYMDSLIGQILVAIPENTLIIFTSDNGPSIRVLDNTGGLRGLKSTLYEGGIRVPLIISGLGVAPGVVGQPGGLQDIFATILEAVGLAGWPDDSLPLLGGFRGHDYMYWGFYDVAGLVEAVRLGNWKGIRFPDRLELYDLASDPGETVDLAAAHPDVVWWMGAIMDRYCPAPKVCRAWLSWVGK